MLLLNLEQKKGRGFVVSSFYSSEQFHLVGVLADKVGIISVNEGKMFCAFRIVQYLKDINNRSIKVMNEQQRSCVVMMQKFILFLAFF